MLIMENSDHSTLSKTNVEDYIQSIATDPNLRGMLYHNLLQRNAIMQQQNEKVCLWTQQLAYQRKFLNITEIRCPVSK